jgi:hypothetical protein
MSQTTNNTPHDSKKAVDQDEYDVFSDLDYLCKSTNVIGDALRNGLDVAQLSNGDIIITETKTVNTQYSWDDKRKKMMRSGHSE